MLKVFEQIDRMSQQERLQMMNHLWMRIIQSGGDFPVPSWHVRVLRETEARVSSGEAIFTPWEEAKDQIRAALA